MGLKENTTLHYKDLVVLLFNKISLFSLSIAQNTQKLTTVTSCQRGVYIQLPLGL
jgi:hypothetical protein